LVFDGSSQTSNTNDFAAGTNFGAISFPATAGAFVLSGNALILGGNITNSSTNLQTINTTLETTAVRTLTMTSGGGNITVGGAISGTGGGITTVGAGTLTLNGANSYTAGTTIGTGTTIKAGNASALGSTTGALTNNGTLDLNALSISKGAYAGTAGTISNTGATAATVTLGNGNGNLNLTGTTVTGNTKLVIEGSGTWTSIGTSSNAHSGGTTFQNNGTVAHRVNAAAFYGNGTITLAGGANLQNSANITLNNNIVISGTNSCNYQQNGSIGMTLNGNITGTGTFNTTQGFNAAIIQAGDMTGFSGTWNLQNAGAAASTNNNSTNLRFSNTTATVAGSSNLQLTQSAVTAGNVNGNNTVQWLGAGSRTIALGDLTTTANGVTGFTDTNIFLQNGTSATTATFEVGALNNSSTYSGIIRNGSGTTAITKIGSGTWTLTGANTYTGATILTQGTLAVTGSLGATPCSAASGTTLLVANGTPDSLSISGGATLSMETAAIGSLSIGGTNGVTLGGPLAGQKSFLKMDAGGPLCDSMVISNNLAIDAGGVDLTISSVGVEANTNYVLATFAAGTGAGFATGTGTTVGGITLTNPSLGFGVTGTLVVDATSITLQTTGAASPSVAYWSGAKGSNWTDNTSGQGNFTTTAAGGTFVSANPGSSTSVFFSNNSATNLSNTLGANFSVNSLTYRAGSGAVTTGGTHQLVVGSGGITVESGNGGAALTMANLVLADSQTWTNNSANPLTVSAAVNSLLRDLNITGSGPVALGGGTFTVGTLTFDADLDLAGSPLTAAVLDSSGDVTNSSATEAAMHLSVSGTTTLSGAISDGTGAVSLTKTGAGALTISGSNSYSGVTSITSGTLILGSPDALGGSFGKTILGAGAILDLNGQSITEDFGAINGAFITNSSETDAAISGAIGNTGSFTVNGSGNITLGQVFNTGAFNVTKTGTGALTVANSVNNGFANFILNEGSLLLAAGPSSSKASDDLTINAGLAQLTTVGGAQGNISDTKSIILNGGTFDLNSYSEAIGGLSGTGGAVTNSVESTSVLNVGGTAVTSTYAGSITDGGANKIVALTKRGTGTLTLTGTLAYTGSTTVTNGTLAIQTASLGNASIVDVKTTPTVGILQLNHAVIDVVGDFQIDGVSQGDGVYGAIGSGAQFETASITGTGRLQVGAAAPGYATWALANAGGQAANLDYDLDGVENGVEYFMNAPAGFTSNPSVVVSAGPVRTVTWPNGGNIPFTDYGTQFKVQTSTNLATWADIASGDPNLSNTAGSVIYTLPTGAGNLFVRLVVTPN
jgi:autotransporter-associated beta strand protein